jgi:hypothetical protein
LVGPPELEPGTSSSPPVLAEPAQGALIFRNSLSASVCSSWMNDTPSGRLLVSGFATALRFFQSSNSPMVAACEFLYPLLHCLARSTPRLFLSQVYRLLEAFYVPRSCKKSGGYVIPTVRYLQGASESSFRFLHPYCEWREAIGNRELTDKFRPGIVGYRQKRRMGWLQ